MATEDKKEGLTKRFDGEGANPSKHYEQWRRWSRAYLAVQKAKGIPSTAHGSLIFALLDGTALRALDATPMEKIEEDGGEDVIFQVLDERFPAEATHDRLGQVLDQVFDLKIEKGESTAVYTAKARAAFTAEKKAVVIAAARQSYKEKDVAAALRTTNPDHLLHAAKQTGTYHVEDGEPVSEQDIPSDENAFEVYLAEAGYAPEDEVEEQDAVDILLTWKQTRAGINQTKLPLRMIQS